MSSGKTFKATATPSLAEQVFGTAVVPADIRAELCAKRSCFMIEMMSEEPLGTELRATTPPPGSVGLFD